MDNQPWQPLIFDLANPSDVEQFDVHLSHAPIRSLHGPWWTLNPWSLAEDPRLQRIAEYLDQPEIQQLLAKCERSKSYPQPVRNQLHGLGLSTFFVDAPNPKSISTWPHLMAVGLLCTSASASLGIDVGVNALGLIPIYLGADDEQLAWMQKIV